MHFIECLGQFSPPMAIEIEEIEITCDKSLYRKIQTALLWKGSLHYKKIKENLFIGVLVRHPLPFQKQVIAFID